MADTSPYWHTKISKVADLPHERPPSTLVDGWHIYYGEQWIAKLIYEYNSYITLEFEKPHWNTIYVSMEMTKGTLWVPREKIISHILKNLDGTQHLTTARERAVVFCTKMRITNNPYDILVRGVFPQ